MEDIAKRIDEISHIKRIKQTQIARQLGIDQANYSKLRRRGSKLSLDQLQAIAGALDVPLAELLGLGQDSEGDTYEKFMELEAELRSTREQLRMVIEANSRLTALLASAAQ